ncbi:AraC family transcriptional regulator [Nocardia rhamnosiphila]
MDPLSDVVTAMRAGDPHSARVVHRAPFGWQFPGVDAAGFHVVLAGRCWFRSAATPEPIALHPGDIVFLPRGCAHVIADDPATPPQPAASSPRRIHPWTPASSAASDTVLLCGAYLLDHSRSHPMLAGLPDVVHIPASTSRHTAAGTIIDLLDAELVGARPGSDAMLRALLDALLLQILRSWLDRHTETAADSGWPAALRNPAVAAALTAIHSDPGHPWTVTELAEHARLSRANFARQFTDLVGRPPIAYLTWWRMTLAAHRLSDTDTPLPVIARHAGYASEFAFAHAFKKHTGCPPGRFRKQHRTGHSLGFEPPDTATSDSVTTARSDALPGVATDGRRRTGKYPGRTDGRGIAARIDR